MKTKSTINLRDTPLDEYFNNSGALPTYQSKISSKKAKELALVLALKAGRKVAPNPMVGAVIVDNNHNYLGSGAHLNYGENHAEVNCINDVYKNSANPQFNFSESTIYVTLEPCSITNNTPACVDRIITEKFAKVVYACVDTNPRINGSGIKKLELADIECMQDLEWKKTADFLIEQQQYIANNKETFVALKAGLSLDGSIGMLGDSRAFITSKRSRKYGHFLRYVYDAILIGKNTLIQDSPSLDCRMLGDDFKSPIKIVLDKDASVLEMMFKQDNYNLMAKLTNNNSRVIWVVATSCELTSRQLELAKKYKIEFLSIDLNKSTLDVKQLLKKLYLLKIHSVLLEGGSLTYKEFIRFNLVNKYYLFYATKLLLGSNRNNIIQGALQDKEVNFKNTSLTVLGTDLLLEMS